MGVTIFEDGANGRLNNRRPTPFNVGNAGASGDGQTDDYRAIKDASDSQGSVGGIYFPPGTYRVGTNLTINCEAIFALGATLEPDAGVTVTLAGPVTTAPGASIIASTALGTVSITGPTNGSGVLDVRTFGAVGDGVTDDTAAIQAAFDAASAAATASQPPGFNPLTYGALPSVIVYVPAGTFAVTSVLNLPANVSLRIDGILKATAVMEAVLQTPLTTVARSQSITGNGIVDCNELANVGIDLRYFAFYKVSDLTVLSFQVSGIRLGDPAAASTSYNASLTNVRTFRGGLTVPSGSIACHIRYATDGTYTACKFIGGETGVKLEAATVWNILTSVHVWNTGSTVAVGSLRDAFYDLGFNNSFIGCYADTPQRYGFYIDQSFARIIGCNVYNGNFGGGDNVLVGVHFANALANAVVTGLLVYGEGASRRVLRDIEFAGGSSAQDTCTIIGNRSNAYVTNVASYRVANNQPFAVTVGTMFLGSSTLRRGTAVPQAAVSAVVGSLNFRSDGGYSTTLAAKNNGSGNTGWGNLWTGEVSADRGDADRTLTVGTDQPIQRFATTLTANRTVTLSTTGAMNGDRFRIVRTGLGAFTLDVGGLKTIPSATAAFVDVSFNGSAWVLTGYGVL